MLPHGKCMELLSNFVIFLPHLKTFVPHHSEASHTQPPIPFFSTVPLLTFVALALNMVNLLLLCNLNFTSSTPLSCLSFSYPRGMQVFYITPALSFWFIIVSSVFQLFSSLDRFSPIQLHLPSFIIISKHGSILHQSPQVPDPFPLALEAL